MFRKLAGFWKCPSELSWKQQIGCNAARGQSIFRYFFYSQIVEGIPGYFRVYWIPSVFGGSEPNIKFFLTFVEGYPIPSHVREYSKYLVIPETWGLGTRWALPLIRFWDILWNTFEFQHVSMLYQYDVTKQYKIGPKTCYCARRRPWRRIGFYWPFSISQPQPWLIENTAFFEPNKNHGIFYISKY